MRALHVVTLLTPDGAYGGPVAVAVNQSGALRSLGHDVELAAGCHGFENPPRSHAGVPVHAMPARAIVPRRGFATFVSPGLGGWLRRHAGTFDVVHLHLARDLIMIPVALQLVSRRVPFVVQPHGMLARRSDTVGRVFDRLLTRPILRRAAAVFYLTDAERADLTEISRGAATLVPLNNGVPLYDPADPVDPAGNATSTGGRRRPVVVFLARLHARKRPLDFVAAARELNDRGIAADYRIIGPDEGEAPKVVAAISEVANIDWAGPIEAGSAPEHLREADVFVLPSVGEPYPMAVLEAMSVGLPVIVTTDCGLAPVVRRQRCGLVVEPGATHVARALATLLDDLDAAREMGRRGRRAIETELGMPAVAAVLEQRYAAAGERQR